MNTEKIDREFYRLGRWFAPVLAAVWALVLSEGERMFALIPSCFVYRYLHIYCPGCGFTRAVYALFHLQITESIRYSAFVPYSFFAYVFYMVHYNRRKRNGGKVISILTLICPGVAILLGQCILKNLC